jgi:hypothetical protein
VYQFRVHVDLPTVVSLSSIVIVYVNSAPVQALLNPVFYVLINTEWGHGIAQLVQQRVLCWMTEESGMDSQQRQYMCLYFTAFRPSLVTTEVIFSPNKAAGVMKLSLASSVNFNEQMYLYYLIHFHGVVLKCRHNFTIYVLLY